MIEKSKGTKNIQFVRWIHSTDYQYTFLLHLCLQYYLAFFQSKFIRHKHNSSVASLTLRQIQGASLYEQNKLNINILLRIMNLLARNISNGWIKCIAVEQNGFSRALLRNEI